jgi:hypothetical protein
MNIKENLQRKFVNITKVTKHVTSLIDNQPMNMEFRDNDIESLLKCHPNEDKIRDVEYLIVRKHPRFNGKTLYIKNKDSKTEEDVSYKYCLRGLFGKYSKAENNLYRIKRAFRDAISDTKRKDLFLNHVNTCQECGRVDQKVHIDHYRYTFQQLLDEFISENVINFSSIKVFENIKNEFEFENNVLKNNWINYHDAKSIFKVLCRICNLSNGTYGYKSINICV